MRAVGGRGRDRRRRHGFCDGCPEVSRVRRWPASRAAEPAPADADTEASVKLGADDVETE
jgi:hypothetical protein